jgi:hypothetical protein
MTGSPIAPIVPGAAGRGEHRTAPRRTARSRRPLPLATIPTERAATAVYGMTVLDRNGRIADCVALRALGWTAGIRLVTGGTRELVTLHAATDDSSSGGSCVTPQGYVRLPAQLRHRCGLRPGDRVLLAADPPQQMLRVYPPSTLDDLLAAVPDESDMPRGDGVR